MFDDNAPQKDIEGKENIPPQPKGPVPPPSQKKVEDMFNENTGPIPPMGPGAYNKPSGMNNAGLGRRAVEMNKFAVLGAIVLFLALVAVGGYYVYNMIFGLQMDSLTNENQLSNNSPSDNAGKSGANNSDFPDADQDGLSDQEEEELGLDSLSVDSDSDGLFDKEEVKVYRTDPLDPDTDGDGFLDGEEVKRGQNPLGNGMLYGSASTAGDNNADADNEKEEEPEVKQQYESSEDPDNDGLTNYEEIEIYKSNPNNPDTDGDGYTDGEEVENGYSPTGKGLLSQ